MEIWLFILVFWLAPIAVGHLIGKTKNRAGWACIDAGLILTP